MSLYSLFALHFFHALTYEVQLEFPDTLREEYFAFWAPEAKGIKGALNDAGTTLLQSSVGGLGCESFMTTPILFMSGS